MTAIHCEVRPGAYYDSVVLMQLQRALADLPGVQDAGVVMATKANYDLLAATGLPVEVTAGPDDLLIVVKSPDDESATAALSQVDALLARRRSTVSQAFRPRSMVAAVKQLPEARWVLISVPGRFAADVARDALALDRHVFLYSDNVSLEDEISLKKIAREKGLLVMGPDCGTAIINGIGFGFANRVRQGNIGLVGAAGTGLQTITSQIHNLGAGVSHAIGTGGRDLKKEVGAITAQMGLDLLASDPATRVIVLVSKPPDAEVAVSLLATARAAGKPVVIDFIGYPPPARTMGNLLFAAGLEDAASLAVQLAQNELKPSPTGKPDVSDSGPIQGYFRGLFSGGTLASETLLGLQSTVTPLFSNVPFKESQRLSDVTRSQGHMILDMGEDVFTQGRLHPMMDNDLRIRRLRQEIEDTGVGIIMLDVVLGEGAHPDPAADLAPAISKALSIAQSRDQKVVIIVVIIGTNADPQNLDSQVERMQHAGAVVFTQLGPAVDYVSRTMSPGIHRAPAFPVDILYEPVSAINVGLELFHDSMKEQGAEVIHVEWKPPAGGNEKLMALLAKMKSG